MSEIEKREQLELKERRHRRRAVYAKHKEFIDNLDKPGLDYSHPCFLLSNEDEAVQKMMSIKAFISKPLKKKFIVFQKKLLRCVDRRREFRFKSEDEEYRFIGKYGRGLFDNKLIYECRAFTKSEQEIMEEIGKEFGAMDY